MKLSLFDLVLNEFLRSANKNKRIATKGILIFLFFYFSIVALVYGFQLAEKLSPDKTENPVSAFNSLILKYIWFDLLLRNTLQNLPTFGIKPFLLIPLGRKKIARFILNKSVLHFFNILPVILASPFVLGVAAQQLSAQSFWSWLASLSLLIFINHFLGIYLKWHTTHSNKWFYGFITTAAALATLEHFQVIPFSKTFGNIFDAIVLYPALVIPVAGTLCFIYFLNLNFLTKHFYIDELSTKEKDNKGVYDFSWLNRVGEYGLMLSLELKMLLRNKRTRTSVLISPLLLFYGLLIYKDHGEGINDTILMLGGIFMTGSFSIMYGQFFPSWHGRYYALLMAQNVKIKQLVQSAFFLMATTNLILYLFSLGYVFITPRVVYVHLCAMLYNIGVNSWIIFGIGLSNRKAIDLDASATFNYQGMSASNWLISFPILFGPLILYALLSAVTSGTIALIVMSLLGLIGIVLHPILLNKFSKAYLKRKHRMIAGYRQS